MLHYNLFASKQIGGNYEYKYITQNRHGIFDQKYG